MYAYKYAYRIIIYIVIHNLGSSSIGLRSSDLCFIPAVNKSFLILHRTSLQQIKAKDLVRLVVIISNWCKLVERSCIGFFCGDFVSYFSVARYKQEFWFMHRLSQSSWSYSFEISSMNYKLCSCSHV